MRNIPSNYYDLGIVDPPYGIGDFRNSYSTERHKKIEWNNEIPSEEYFHHLYRITKNRIIFGCNYFSPYIKDKGRIVHDKTGGGYRNFPKQLSDCDIASHSFGINMKIFHYTSSGNVIGKKIDWKNTMKWHPCQKPIQLYKWLLLNYAAPGHKIFDSHLGSGSIAIACHDLGYTLDGYEIDSDYYSTALDKLRKHQQQLTLFN